MQEVLEYPHATFCWAELSTTDQEAAKSFYRSIFGWTFADIPMGSGEAYTLLRLLGKNVASISSMSEEMRSQKTPPSWMSYVSVIGIDEVCKRVSDLGGTLIMPGFDVEGYGRMAIIADPGRAYVGLWEPGRHIGASYVNTPGAMTWNELLTHDVDGVRTFYEDLFGWTSETESSIPYTLFLNKGHHAAGMMPIDTAWGTIPSHWAIYFAVEDCDEAVSIAKQKGGTVLKDPFDIQGVGRMSMLRDPQGAVFNVMRVDRFDPPPSV